MVRPGATESAAMFRILCYGDSNTWGCGPTLQPPAPRHPPDSRWPRVLGAELGPHFEIIEEGLNARTTDTPDPAQPAITGAGVDGAAYLPACLASHLPLDFVVIMLGTNDLKAHFDRSPLRIALGAGRLVDIVQRIHGGIGTPYESPQVLLICPPPLGNMVFFADEFAGGLAKSQALPAAYAAVAKAAGALFLDASTVISTDGPDGLHLSAAAQTALGRAVAEILRGHPSLV
jgi:lysophospholipase L1-like esterase